MKQRDLLEKRGCVVCKKYKMIPQFPRYSKICRLCIMENHRRVKQGMPSRIKRYHILQKTAVPPPKNPYDHIIFEKTNSGFSYKEYLLQKGIKVKRVHFTDVRKHKENNDIDVRKSNNHFFLKRTPKKLPSIILDEYLAPEDAPVADETNI